MDLIQWLEQWREECSHLNSMVTVGKRSYILSQPVGTSPWESRNSQISTWQLRGVCLHYLNDPNNAICIQPVHWSNEVSPDMQYIPFQFVGVQLEDHLRRALCGQNGDLGRLLITKNVLLPVYGALMLAYRKVDQELRELCIPDELVDPRPCDLNVFYAA